MGNKQHKLRVYTLFITLLLLGILPAMSGAILHASSAAFGVLTFTVLSLPFIYKYIPSMQKIPKKFILFFILFFIYSLIQHLFIGEWNDKAYLSIPALFYIFTVAYLSAGVFRKIDFIILFQSIKILVYTLIIIAFFNIFTDYKLGKLYGHWSAVFPFGEPSHYALFSGMFFIVYFVFSKSMVQKVVIISVAGLLAILFPNTTMLIYALLMASLLIKFNFKNIILLIVGISIIFNIVFTSNYFQGRINISKDSTNLSALVYLQGLDYAKKSLIDTNGLGLGFQMMGTQKESDISKQILHVMGDIGGTGVNRYDGGFLAAKIVTEFGIFGIFILLSYLLLWLKSFLHLRKYVNNISKKNDPKILVMHAIFFSFIVEIFIRGIGYFSPSVFIFLVSFFFYFKFSGLKLSKRMRRYSEYTVNS